MASGLNASKLCALLSLRGAQFAFALSGATLTLLSVLSIFYVAEVPMNATEFVQVRPAGLWDFVSTIGVIGLVLGGIIGARFIPPKFLFSVLSLLLLAAGYLFVHEFIGPMRADARLTYEAAEAFLRADYSAFQPGGYMHMYPHQSGLMYYYAIGQSFFNGYKWVYYLNVMWVWVINLALWRIVSRVSGANPWAESAAIVLPFAFVPHFAFVLFGYNQTPALAAFAVALYFLVRYVHTEGGLHWAALSAVFLTTAILIRPNYKIAAVAFGAVLLIRYLERLRKRDLLIIAVIMMLAVGVPKAVGRATEEISGSGPLTGVPTAAWLSLGLQDSAHDPSDFDIARERPPGWYNGYTSYLWSETGYDSALTHERAIADFSRYAKARWNSPDRGFGFFAAKVKTTWCEPTYQSFWSGWLPDLEDVGFRVPWIQNLYSGGDSYSTVSGLLRGVATLIFAGAAWTVLSSLRQARQRINIYVLTVGVFVLGAFIFHLFWETKSQYVYGHMVLLISLAALSFSACDRLPFKQHLKRAPAHENGG